MGDSTIVPMDDIIRERPVVEPLGVFELETPLGRTLFGDSGFFTATLMTPPSGPDRIVLLMAGPGPVAAAVGFAAQFDQDSARTLAAALCQLADKLGAVKQ